MKHPVSLLVLCCTAFVLGTLVGPQHLPDAAFAQTDDKQPAAFLSGGARSERVLKDIHTTLVEMDKRVASIEEILKKASEKSSAGSSGTTR